MKKWGEKVVRCCSPFQFTVLMFVWRNQETPRNISTEFVFGNSRIRNNVIGLTPVTEQEENSSDTCKVYDIHELPQVDGRPFFHRKL
jgi:hypothetical protein